MPLLSKSKYLAGLQCPLLLWTHFNDRGAIPPPDEGTRWIFDNGHRVGDLAKRLWPDGIEVPFGRAAETDARTRALLPKRVPIFEASFFVDSRYCRVDILEPGPDGRWNLIEVKSSTKVKDVNLDDVAFQADSLERAGVKLSGLFLMHIDRDYVRQGKVDPEQLFHREDVTDRALDRMEKVTPYVLQMLDCVGGPRPEVPIGRRCENPYTCALKPQCWKDIPDHHATTLSHAGIKAFGFMRQGWHTIAEIPADDLRPAQRIQQQCVIRDERHVDEDAVREWLGRLRWPVYHLDFETMATPIPIFEGTRPYQKIPFQFSLHVQPGPEGEPDHVEFLAMDSADPRPTLLEALRAIGPEGTIVVFNRGFETSVLNALGEDFPEYRSLTDDLVERMEDLAEPFRRFDLYDPAQYGSYSLKRVLPAWTDRDYGSLAIQDGQQAAREYEKAVHGADLGLHREEVAEHLREYCRQDTWAMVELLRVLQEIAG